MSSYSLRILKKINKEIKEDNSFPSKNNKRDWVFANGDYKSLNKHTDIPDSEQGKWLIFTRELYVDGMWHKIMDVYKTGALIGGAGGKCSTKKSHVINPDGKYVIVIYCLNEEQKCHNRKTLREILGITWKIPYKLEKDTGIKYSWDGDRNISKYFE